MNPYFEPEAVGYTRDWSETFKWNYDNVTGTLQQMNYNFKQDKLLNPLFPYIKDPICLLIVMIVTSILTLEWTLT
jgi:hypothetical protein